MLFTTVRIETFSERGSGTGTGFIVNFEDKSGNTAYFIVTNKHVLKDYSSAKFFFFLHDGEIPQLGTKVDINLTNLPNQWFGHPNDDIDVAVIPVAHIHNELYKRGDKHYFNWINVKDFPIAENINLKNPIQEIVFVGYPIGMYDTKNYLPIVRRGITASPPTIDYCGRPIFLIDAAVFPGSSGSPVFALNERNITVEDDHVRIGKGYSYLVLSRCSLLPRH